jgi:prepilin-type N-terminal cleavage/methylation domain-containing protein
VLKRIRAAREDGFTLTELLIVVVVLGILAGIVVFAVNTFASDSEKAACEADKKTVQTAAEAFKAKSTANTYPASTAALKTAGLLRDDITGKKWSFTIDTTTGNVTTVPAGFC